jgi:integrase
MEKTILVKLKDTYFHELGFLSTVIRDACAKVFEAAPPPSDGERPWTIDPRLHSHIWHALTAAANVKKGSNPSSLFFPVNKGDRITPRRMTDQAILWLVRRRAEDADVSRFSPHDLRRTFVSDLLDAGADLSTTKRLAGHASEATTGRYDRRGEEAKKRAAQLLHVPYYRIGSRPPD